MCPNQVANIFRLIGLMFIFVLAICFLIRSTLKGAVEKKNVTSIYTKILFSHLQLLLLTASFEFDWPDYVDEFFAVAEPIAEVS